MQEAEKQSLGVDAPTMQTAADTLSREERGAWVIAGAVLLGSLMITASLLVSPNKKSDTNVAVGSPTPNQPAAVPTQPGEAPNKSGVVSIDDDPVLGDRKKAKVAIVEFSDYECPFCKKFHDETYDQIVKDFVNTGKAIMVFRDLPLPFHEPKATEAAQYGQCVKDAKGDTAYFAFSKAYFSNTQTNGKGLPEGKMDEVLKQVGVNVETVKNCAVSAKFKDEIAKDASDAAAVGISGTPSFVVGKLDSKGMVTGEVLVGARSYDNFKQTIERYLK